MKIVVATGCTHMLSVWILHGLMTPKRKQDVRDFVFNEDLKTAVNIQIRGDIETFSSKINVVSQSKKELQAQKMPRENNEVYRRAVRSGNAAKCTRAKGAKQLQVSLGSALLTGAKIPKVPETEEFVSTVNRCRCRKGNRKDIGRVQSERHLRERVVFAKPSDEWYLPGKERRVCNGASKCKEVCLKDKLLAAHDLLQGLIWTILWFRAGPSLLYSKAAQLVIKSNWTTSKATVIYSIADNTVHKSKMQKLQNPDRFETVETKWAV